jgi:hypothetical protein
MITPTQSLNACLINQFAISDMIIVYDKVVVQNHLTDEIFYCFLADIKSTTATKLKWQSFLANDKNEPITKMVVWGEHLLLSLATGAIISYNMNSNLVEQETTILWLPQWLPGLNQVLSQTLLRKWNAEILGEFMPQAYRTVQNSLIGRLGMLFFSEQVMQLNACKCRIRWVKCFEALHGLGDFLNESMVLFHDIIEAFDLSHSPPNINNRATCQLMVSIQALLAPLLSMVTFSGNPLEPLSFSKNALAASSSCFSESKKSTVLPSLSTAR